MPVKFIAAGVLGLWLSLLSTAGLGQTPKSTSRDSNTRDVSLCSLLKSPRKWQGRMVRVRGSVIMGFETFTISDSGCESSMEFADETGPRDASRHLLHLRNDENMQEFKKVIGESADEDPVHPCQRMHCMKYHVLATIEGRFDYRPTTCTPPARNDQKCGFGHLGEWSTELVITSVSDISAKELQ